jgi:hypothetical protein
VAIATTHDIGRIPARALSRVDLAKFLTRKVVMAKFVATLLTTGLLI